MRWIRFRNHATADRLFYKPLVKQCRGVDLSEAAMQHGDFPPNTVSWLRTQLTQSGPPLNSIAEIPVRLVEPPQSNRKPGSVAP